MQHEPENVDPCVPTPCGPFSQCVNRNGIPSCQCLNTYVGAPPNCRPECSVRSECPGNKACIRNKCIDPCPGLCGINAICNVFNHVPLCVCIDGYVGDPFVNCNQAATHNEPIQRDPCNPSPCGPNAQCLDGQCSCLSEYQGDPYSGCRPECVLNSDCPKDKACLRNKCKDPCPGTCGQNAICNVINNIPMCSCPQGLSGNAFIQCTYSDRMYSLEKNTSCSTFAVKIYLKFFLAIGTQTPCHPSPCGPNSQCRVSNGQSVCSCVHDYVGVPPTCRPECVSNSECPLNQACSNQKCRDPCPGTCGINAHCRVIKHNPICSCSPRYTGNPFARCQPISKSRQRTQIVKLYRKIISYPSECS